MNSFRMLNGEPVCKRSRSEGTQSEGEGERGPMGPMGPTGPDGPTGLDGPQGMVGDDGSDGAPGIQGEQGEQGEQGGENGSSSFLSYTTENLPGNKPNGTIAFDTTLGLPVYFKFDKWYKLNDNVEIADVSINIYLIAGQSNAVGYGYTNDLPSDLDLSNVKYWSGSNWEDMTVGSTNAAGNNRFGYEVPLANLVEKPSYFIKYAVGGTNLHTQWNPNTGGKYAGWKTTFDNAIAGLGTNQYNIKGMFWMQGESDTTSDTVANAYEANLNNLISQMRNDVDTNMKFFIGKIKYWNGGPVSKIDIIRSAQDAVANDDNNVFTIETNDLSLTDSIHYNSGSLVTMAERFYNKLTNNIQTSVWTTINNKKYYIDEYGDTYKLLLRQNLKVDINGDAWTNGKTYGGWDLTSTEKTNVINTKQLNSSSDPEIAPQYLDFALTESEWDDLRGGDDKLTFKMRWPEMRTGSELTNIFGINTDNVKDFMTWKQRDAPNYNQVDVGFEEIDFGINTQMYKHDVYRTGQDFNGIYLNDLTTSAFKNKQTFLDGNMGAYYFWWGGGAFNDFIKIDGETALPIILKNNYWYRANKMEVWVKKLKNKN